MRKRVPLPGVLSHFDLAVVGLDNPGDKAEAKAEALFRRWRGSLAGDAVEAVEDVRQVLSWGCRVRVSCDDQFDELRLRSAALHSYFAALGRELERVGKQVGDHALDLHAIDFAWRKRAEGRR